jgi:hypothetical protein
MDSETRDRLWGEKPPTHHCQMLAGCIRMQVEFSGALHGDSQHLRQAVQVNEPGAQQENDIVEIVIEAMLDFTEGDGIGIKNVYIELVEALNEYVALRGIWRQGDRTLQGDGLEVDLQFASQALQIELPIRFVQIVAQVIEIEGGRGLPSRSMAPPPSKYKQAGWGMRRPSSARIGSREASFNGSKPSPAPGDG